MLANFHFPGATDYIFPWGTPGNTGDGIKLAAEAGAALWHMATVEWGFRARKPSRIRNGDQGRPREACEGSFVFVNQYRKGSCRKA
jgi:hypothetical protein